MDISQLRTLVHVAELGSVSKAADRLNVTQPSLSRQIRLLEQELGTYLFERHGRGMVITDLGREVVSRAARIIAEMDAIRDTAEAGRTTFRGSISIGTTPTVAEIVTVPLVTRLRALHPDLSLRLSSAYSGHILDWLQRGQIDIAVSYNPSRVHSLRIVPIMLESLLLVRAGTGNPDETIPFHNLAELDLVLPSSGHLLRDIVDNCAQRAGIRLKTSIEADSFQTLISLVRNGFGATILPLAPIHALVEAGQLYATRLTDPAPTRELVVSYAADRPISPAARYIGKLIVEIALDLAERGIWAGHAINAEDVLPD